MEEIANRCAGLRLSDIEEREVDLAPPMPKAGHVLAGKFYTKRRVNLESVARVLKSVWRTEKNFEVCDMGDNKVLVLLLSPWSFDKYLVVLHKLRAGETVNRLTFNKASFWVQIHGLPTMNQMRETGLWIGGILGMWRRLTWMRKGSA